MEKTVREHDEIEAQLLALKALGEECRRAKEAVDIDALLSKLDDSQKESQEFQTKASQIDKFSLRIEELLALTLTPPLILTLT